MAQMKIRVDEDGHMVLGEVFSGAFIEIAEGNLLGFCLRDDTVELNIIPAGSTESQWYRVNMQTLEMEKMSANPYTDPDGENGMPDDKFRSIALDLTNAIIAELKGYHIQFEGKLTHTGRDMVAENIVEPFLRRALDQRIVYTKEGENG